MTNPQRSLPRTRTVAGRIITGVVIAFLIFDGAAKILHLNPVVEASGKLGIAPGLLTGIGILLLACTSVFAYPKTAISGAILLTGYLGGATAIHVAADSGLFAIAFTLCFGALVWLGLLLRTPGLLGTLLHRN